MANIKVELGAAPIDGQELVFKAPCGCSSVGGLKLYYPGGSAVYTFRDANLNNLGSNTMLFASGAILKVIVDTVNKYAFILNADSNNYLNSYLDACKAHRANVDNPHSVTKSQVGLGNVTNDKQMPIAGGTFTGAVTLNSDPTANLHAATKQSVDKMMPKSGGTFTGNVKAYETARTTRGLFNEETRATGTTSNPIGGSLKSVTYLVNVL